MPRMSYVGMYVVSMIKIGGMQLGTRLKKAMLIFFVFRKQNENPLIFITLESLHLKDLINLTSVPPWGSLGVS